MELTQEQVSRIRTMAAQCLKIMETQDRNGQYNVLIKLYTDQFKESNKSREYYNEVQRYMSLNNAYTMHMKQYELKIAEMQKSMTASATELQNEKAKTYSWYQAYTEQKATLEKDNAEQDKLKEEIESLKQENSKMQQQLDSFKENTNDETLQKMLVEQQKQNKLNEELRQENTSLQSKIENYKSELEIAKNQNATSEAEEKLSAEIDNLNAENHQLKIQLEEFQQKQPEQVKINRALHEKNEKLLKEVDNLRGERQLLREQLEQEEEKNNAKKDYSNRDDLDDEMEELLEEKESLEDKVDELKNVNKQLKEQLTQMKEKSKESVMLQKKCNELIAKNKWLQKQNDNLEATKKEDKKSGTMTIQEQFERMGLNYDEMQQQIDSLKIEKEQLLQQKLMLEERSKLDIEALRQEITKLKNQLGADNLDNSVENVTDINVIVPDVPEAPVLHPSEYFSLATSIEEVDKHENAKFLSVLLNGIHVELREMPAQGAPIVVINNLAYPNPYFYKGFISAQETLSSIRPLRNLFEIEGIQEDWQVKYSLESIEPAKMKTIDSQIQLEEKGKLILQSDIK